VPEFPDFNAATAEAASGHHDKTGLGGFLGITTIDLGPGRMRCGVEVRPDLLNPFGMMHGGVISALVDHVLGAVWCTACDLGV
jgi:uncharacterized protein (TIGR00369 family)